MDLNEKIDLIAQELDDFRNMDLEMTMSSSFQSHSIPLLHMISRFAPEVEVIFLDTGFHFPETILFRDQMVRDLGLRLRILRSPVPKQLQVDRRGYFLFTSDPDRCCAVNKTLPMKNILGEYDVWISGLRRDQNSHRQGLKKTEQTNDGLMRYYPILEWNSRDVWEYRVKFDLPPHPLEEKGFSSIGCEPCTRSDLEGRGGRWFGQKKTECGLHLNKD
jgi:phosphoadenosine phosphosulfate reductase